jgi:hypothetical protein
MMERGKTIPKLQWLAWANAGVLLVLSWFAMAGLSLQTQPGAEVVAVVFPPWWNAQRAFLASASADAAIVRITAVPSLLVVRPNRHDGLTRLRQAGAWLVMNPQAIAACFSK